MTLALGTANEASDAFARLLGPLPAPPGPGDLLGLEHEFALRVNGRRLDFRRIIHRREIAGHRVDPGDANAYRCRSGILLTCDDAEAEVATPPIDVRRGFAGHTEAWAAAAGGELRHVLPDVLEAEGVSTHLSASMPAALNDAACYLFAKTFAPSVMLLLDRADSYGIDVRPRAGRLEINGEYLTGARLGLTAAFFAGAVRACAAALSGAGGARDALPPVLRLDLRQCEERYGVRVVRHAFGGDLYREGRGALLTAIGGTTITAQRHLELSWAAARAALGGLIGTAEERALEDIIAGRAPLRVEEPPAATNGLVTRGTNGSELDSPFARLAQACDGTRADLRSMTWDFAVMEFSGDGRPVFACVPGAAFGRFAEALEAGGLDAAVRDYAAAETPGRALRRYADTRAPALWDAVPDPVALLPEEYGLEQHELGAQARAALLSPVYRSQLGHALAAANGDAGAAAPERVDTFVQDTIDIDTPGPLVRSAARPYKYTRGGRVEDGGGWNWWFLIVPGIIALIVIGIVTFFLLSRTSEEETFVPPATVTETATIAVQETPPEPSPPGETARPVLSGTYVTELTVSDDPAGHEEFVDMPGELDLDVLIVRDTSTGEIAIDITGAAPWVALHGTAQFGPGFTSTGGAFTATGTGTVAGYTNVSVRFEGSVTADGGLVGELTMGVNGELPAGQAIRFAVTGRRP